MNHRARLDKIEKEFGETIRRCDVCHTWPAYRTEHDVSYAALNGPPPAHPPRSCPNCGFEPIKIYIRYADDWRAA